MTPFTDTAKVLLLVAIVLVTAACEALPVVHVSVIHDEAGAPRFDEIRANEPSWPELNGEPIASALIVVSAQDEAAPEMVEDDASLLQEPQEPLPPVGRGGALGSLPARMQTNENGHAQYRELRIQPLPFVGFGARHLRITISADGYRPISLPIAIRTGAYVLVVPMQRDR